MNSKPLLFIDFDGTLCFDKFWRSLETEQAQKIQDYLFSSDKTIIRDWMGGIYTSEDINKKVALYLGIKENTLWNIFVKECKSMFIDKILLYKINKLRENYFVILATDNMDCFDRFTVPALNLKEYFDLIVSSYTSKTSKNDNEGKLFEDIAIKLESTLSQSFLIDNSVKTCELFEKRGGKAFLVTSEEPLSYWLEGLNER